MRQTRYIVLGLIASHLIPFSISWGWYPYSDRYTKWQEQRPITMAGWHACIGTDHMPDRIAQYQAAGLNQFFSLKLQDAYEAGYFQACREAGLEWQGGMKPHTTRQDSDWESQWEAAQARVRKAMEIGGGTVIHVWDEPNDQQKFYDAIRERIAWVHENYPDVLAFA